MQAVAVWDRFSNEQNIKAIKETIIPFRRDTQCLTGRISLSAGHGSDAAADGLPSVPDVGGFAIFGGPALTVGHQPDQSVGDVLGAASARGFSSATAAAADSARRFSSAAAAAASARRFSAAAAASARRFSSDAAAASSARRFAATAAAAAASARRFSSAAACDSSARRLAFAAAAATSARRFSFIAVAAVAARRFSSAAASAVAARRLSFVVTARWLSLAAAAVATDRRDSFSRSSALCLAVDSTRDSDADHDRSAAGASAPAAGQGGLSRTVDTGDLCRSQPETRNFVAQNMESGAGGSSADSSDSSRTDAHSPGGLDLHRTGDTGDTGDARDARDACDARDAGAAAAKSAATVDELAESATAHHVARARTALRAAAGPRRSADRHGPLCQIHRQPGRYCSLFMPNGSIKDRWRL